MAYFSTLTPIQKAYVKVVMKAAVCRSDRVITDSAYSKAELIRFFPVCEEKVQVIPLGINSQVFCREGKGDQELLQPYQLPDQFLLFVGHIRQHKNVQGLLKAFEKLSHENKELSLVMTFV